MHPGVTKAKVFQNATSENTAWCHIRPYPGTPHTCPDALITAVVLQEERSDARKDDGHPPRLRSVNRSYTPEHENSICVSRNSLTIISWHSVIRNSFFCKFLPTLCTFLILYTFLSIYILQMLCLCISTRFCALYLALQRWSFFSI